MSEVANRDIQRREDKKDPGGAVVETNVLSNWHLNLQKGLVGAISLSLRRKYKIPIPQQTLCCCHPYPQSHSVFIALLNVTTLVNVTRIGIDIKQKF